MKDLANNLPRLIVTFILAATLGHVAATRSVYAQAVNGTLLGTFQWNNLGTKVNEGSMPFNLGVDPDHPNVIDADLGGRIIKQRVARPGEGKRAGFRLLVGFGSHRHSGLLPQLAGSTRPRGLLAGGSTHVPPHARTPGA